MRKTVYTLTSPRYPQAVVYVTRPGLCTEARVYGVYGSTSHFLDRQETAKRLNNWRHLARRDWNLLRITITS